MPVPSPIFTQRLRLIPVTLPLCEALIAGDEAVAALLHTSVAPNWSEFGLSPWEFGRKQLQQDPECVGWWGWLVIHAADACMIGVCGYKGYPQDETVEIGYEIAPDYRNRGFAREAATALIERAFALPGIAKVMAHTLAEPNASTRVLTALGFAHAGVVEDPDEGPVWAWQKLRP